jgi:hypothetical protein
LRFLLEGVALTPGLFVNVRFTISIARKFYEEGDLPKTRVIYGAPNWLYRTRRAEADPSPIDLKLHIGASSERIAAPIQPR